SPASRPPRARPWATPAPSSRAPRAPRRPRRRPWRPRASRSARRRPRRPPWPGRSSRPCDRPGWSVRITAAPPRPPSSPDGGGRGVPRGVSAGPGVYGGSVSLQRVIRPAARRTPAGARPLVWTAAAAALPVIVVVLVLVAVTLGALVFTASGFDSLFAVVAVEWLVINLVPLSVDDVALGFLPLLPALVLVSVLARQTRTVLADVERPGPREAGSAVAGVVLGAVLVTVLATLVVGSADSDFAVAPVNLPAALGWTVAVAAAGSGLGVWLYFRSDLREALPLWVRGGLHLGAAFVPVVWAVATALVLIGLLGAWGNVANVLGIGKDFLGIASLAAIS